MVGVFNSKLIVCTTNPCYTLRRVLMFSVHCHPRFSCDLTVMRLLFCCLGMTILVSFIVKPTILSVVRTLSKI